MNVDKSLSRCYQPFDVVSDKDGNVGYICEVNVNECQPEMYQLSYAIKWLVGDNDKYAWFDHEELLVHSNIMQSIAKQMCSFSGKNTKWIDMMFLKERSREDDDERVKDICQAICNLHQLPVELPSCLHKHYQSRQ